MLSKRRYFKRQTPRDYRTRVKKSPFSRHSNHRNTSRDPDTKLSGSRELGIGYKFMSSQYLLLQHTSHIFGKKLVLHYPYSLSCHLPVYHLAKKTCKRKESGFILAVEMCISAAKIHISAAKMFISAAEMKENRMKELFS